MTYQIPWDEDKGQPWNWGASKSWRDNFEFEATLTMTSMYWSYGSAVHWTDEAGGVYTMFITDFEKALLAGKSVIDRKITGRFTFIKRGTKFGIRFTDVPR